jgi:hypothetical protein
MGSPQRRPHREEISDDYTEAYLVLAACPKVSRSNSYSLLKLFTLLLTLPDLEGIALGILVAALCSGTGTPFLAVLDVKLLTMFLALAPDHGGPTAKDTFAVAAPAQLVAPLFGDLGAGGKFILDLAHRTLGNLIRSSIGILCH